MSERPIRVLRVIARLNVGGPALHVSYLARGLATRGYETTLVAGDLAHGEESMAFVAAEQGVRVVRLEGLSREISPLSDLRSAMRLRALIRELRPDVLHTHTAKAGAVGRLAALLAGRQRPRVIVHTFHGHVLHGYFGSVGSRFFRSVERMLGRWTDVLIAVSPEISEELVRFRIAPARKFRVIRLGIDLARRTGGGRDRAETLARVGIPTDAFVVGWFGRMTAIKRTADLVDVLATLRAQGVDAKLLLVGDGYERERVEERAHEKGVARHCLFAGYQEDVAPWYRAVDAVVLTSGNEGTPVTMIEALAAGTPVVSYNVGGVPDVIEDGVSGHLVPRGDTRAMARCLAELAAEPVRARRMGAAGAASVRERYAVERLVGDVDALYRELLATSPPTSVR